MYKFAVASVNIYRTCVPICKAAANAQNNIWIQKDLIPNGLTDLYPAMTGI